LINDKTRPHFAARTKETLQELKCKAFDHPVYSSDLTQSGFHLFGRLKGFQKSSVGSNEVMETVHDWLRNDKNI
jgi:hypothetical protein